jgi:putative flippase GtrA
VRNLVREAFWYSAASGVGLVVDVGLLWILVERFHWYYLAAATLSFVAGTVVVYVLSVGLIFKHREITDRRMEFAVFATIGMLGVMVNLAVLKTAVDHFHVHYLLGKLASVAFTFSLNFGLRRALLFTPRAASGSTISPNAGSVE